MVIMRAQAAMARELISEAMGALREAGPFIAAAGLLFAVSIAAGATAPSRAQGLVAGMTGIAREMSGRSLPLLILSILLRNSLSAGLSIFLGPLLGIVPLLAAIVNGLLVGAALAGLHASRLPTAILLLLPHGVFELPAMFIAWGIGLWRGLWFLRGGETAIRGRKGRSAFRVYCFVVLPLLGVAAVIEGSGIALMRR